MLILAQPLKRPGIGERSTTIVSPSSATVVDSVPDTTLSNKWIVTASDSIDEIVSSYEILAVNKFGTKLTHTTYGLIGDRVPHTIDIKYNGPSIEVEVTNTGTNDLLINIVRIETNN